ncbi:MAG: APC family permease [Pseudolabrys sp.]
MDAAGRKLSLAEITAIGIGGMIGGGIFAVLGLAIAQAGHAVPITLAVGGVIALLTGLSYAHLGLALRGDGGSFTYIEHAFGWPGVAAIAGWLLVAGYVGTLALYATAFGAYGETLFDGTGTPGALAQALATLVLVGFLIINLGGAKTSGATELAVVAVKLAILAAFAVAGLHTAQASHFQPLFDHGWLTAFAAAALIFVAYEGFELIPNAIDEMENPRRNLRRAIVIAIVATAVLYIVVALAALGNLSAAQIERDQEYVLAVAARPTMGQFGFVLVGVAALLSTASAINATLFGAARLAMVMASEHALPRVFSLRARVRPVPWVALIALTALSLAFALTAPLAVISTFASATFLLIFFAINVSAWRLRKRIALAGVWPLTGALATAAGFVLLMARTFAVSPHSLYWIAGFYAAAIIIETALTLWRGRRSAARR